MNLRRFLIPALLVWLFGAVEARAHFLFIKVGPVAEGGRWAEVYFSEFAEAGDPRYITKVAAGTTLRIQKKPGQVEPLNALMARDRLRAIVPSTEPMIVYADCVYGVLDRTPPFLLRHYAKGIAGTAEEINAFEPEVGTPLEISAKIVGEGKAIQLTALKERTPAPLIEFTTIDAQLNNTTIKANNEGSIVWVPPAPGRYSVTVRSDSKVKGDHNGKAFEEIRDFATIAFDWPLARDDSDDEAVSLFEQALSARANWGENFKGFQASLSGVLDGRPYSGSVVVAADGAIEIDADEESAIPWLQDQIGSLVRHRKAEPKGADRPIVRFGDDDKANPLGRLLAFDGGRFASSYRIKDGGIKTVNRCLGESNITIVTLEEERNKEGRSLPRSYIVQYWDARTGALDRAETVTDRWIRVGEFDLPAEHLVTTSSSAGFSVRSLRFAEHSLRSADR
jgi:Protein of unknown function (DUF3386)